MNDWTDTARRWAPVLLIFAIAAPAAAIASPTLQAFGLFAWGCAKVAAFGVLGIVLDRFIAPHARPHVLREEVIDAMRRNDPEGMIAARIGAHSAALYRRALTVLGCQIAGAML